MPFATTAIISLAVAVPASSARTRRNVEDSSRSRKSPVSAQHDRRPFSLLYIDLDHFKEINETRGHDAGDLLLKEVAERLRTLVRETDTVARLGGDEFAVLVQGREPAQAIHMAERIEAALKVPYLAAPDITVSASVGNR